MAGTGEAEASLDSNLVPLFLSDHHHHLDSRILHEAFVVLVCNTRYVSDYRSSLKIPGRLSQNSSPIRSSCSTRTVVFGLFFAERRFGSVGSEVSSAGSGTSTSGSG